MHILVLTHGHKYGFYRKDRTYYSVVIGFPNLAIQFLDIYFSPSSPHKKII